ncbi:MAG: hypothetical protein HRT36_07700, partial [Alphaproteobacteria bacterium]|nr:hypothetical protein [Alphaproteobacteria bacterium]
MSNTAPNTALSHSEKAILLGFGIIVPVVMIGFSVLFGTALLVFAAIML